MKKLISALMLLMSMTAFAAETFGPPAPGKFENGYLVLNPNPNKIILTKDNTLTINDVFTSDTVAAIAAAAKDLDARVDSLDPIYLVIHSPGGSIDDGMELMERLSSLRRPVKTITLFSASMGFQTVQALDERLITNAGTLMSHKPRGGMYGEFPGQLDSRYAHYLKRTQNMDIQAVKRTKGKQTIESYRNLIQYEYWCDGQECVDGGFADRVVSATCDKSLDGSTEQTIYQDLIRGMRLEITANYDNCPMNTNPIRYTIYIDGEPLFARNNAAMVAKTGLVNQETAEDRYIRMLLGASAPKGVEGIPKDALADIKAKADEVIHKKQDMRNQIIRGY